MPGFDPTTRWGRFRTYLVVPVERPRLSAPGLHERPLDQPRAGARQPAVAAPAGRVEEAGDQDRSSTCAAGSTPASTPWRSDACDRLGLKMVDFAITSREVPIPRAGAGRARPVREHRVSGPDALQVRRGPGGHHERALHATSARACRSRRRVEQLSFKYLHIKQGKTGRAGLHLRTLPDRGRARQGPDLHWSGWRAPIYDPAEHQGRLPGRA